jgi:CxxC-x17-CxxC domain-containing protein
MEEFKDKWLDCADCGELFLWDAGEQHWFWLMHLLNVPKRCKKCRDKRRDDKKNQPRESTAIRCERCGQVTRVPFVPRGTKPVYCRSCLAFAQIPSVTL